MTQADSSKNTVFSASPGAHSLAFFTLEWAWMPEESGMLFLLLLLWSSFPLLLPHHHTLTPVSGDVAQRLLLSVHRLDDLYSSASFLFPQTSCVWALPMVRASRLLFMTSVKLQKNFGIQVREV